MAAAERNLAGRAGRSLVHFHWADASLRLPVDRLDFVITNPPFHAGRETVPALGRAFVRAALAALKPLGRLFLVANRHLPYESELQALSAPVERRLESGGFKVIEARKANEGKGRGHGT